MCVYVCVWVCVRACRPEENLSRGVQPEAAPSQQEWDE